MLYGYARVSSTDQDLSIQHAALTAAGCNVIRSEKVTGTTAEGREKLSMLLEFLREGDTLVVTRVDRLARSLRDLQNIVHDLQQRGVALNTTEQPIDTPTAAGKCFLDMLGVFAEFETNLRRERQGEGIARAKANGVYAGKGRPASIDATRVREMKAKGLAVPPPSPRSLASGGRASTGCWKRIQFERCAENYFAPPLRKTAATLGALPHPANDTSKDDRYGCGLSRFPSRNQREPSPDTAP
jgi:DNA invertase Pin-like site-specific DNA recombinase